MNEKIFAEKWLLLAGLLACALTGCGAEQPDYLATKLEGVVSVDGEKIVDGSISIVPTKKGQGRGVETAIIDGRYTIEKAPLGSVIVTLHALRDTGRTYYSEQAEKEVPEMESLIPNRYAMGIPLQISEGMGEQNFELSRRQKFDKKRTRRSRR